MKIRDQHFDDNRRIHFLDRSDHAREVIRTSVFQIVPRHGSDDDVLQFHSHHRFGDALRLIVFQGERLCRGHRAKSTGARATISRNHKRSRALTPTFPAVRALRAFTNRVQPQIGNERLGRKENRVRRQTDFDPGGLMGLVQRRIDFRAGHRHRS